MGNYVSVEVFLSNPIDRDGKGTDYTLTDNTGSIQVVFWNNSVPIDLQRKVVAAKRVRITGKVRTYQGAVLITPGENGLEIP